MEFSFLLQPLNLTILLYLSVIFVIGIRASFFVKKISDFVLADRKLSGPIVALGAGASDMSSWLLLALPGLVFAKGLNQIWLPLALVVGAYCNWKFIAVRLRIFTEILQSLTIPSYLNKRFPGSNKFLSIITSMVVIIFFTYYASASFYACAITAHQLFNLSYDNALFISASIMICYTCLGGFLAVNWIDFFQGILMFLGLLIVPIFASIYIEWDFQDLIAIPEYLNIYSELSIISFLSLLGWGLGYFGQPHILVRFMAVRNHNELPLARRICMSWMFLGLIGAVCTALVGKVYYNGVLDNPETVFVVMAKELFNPWVTGLVVAAVLSAIMSSITAQLLNASSALVEDIYHGIFRKEASQKELLWVSRLAVVIIGMIAVSFALGQKTSVFNIVKIAWSGLGASFGPVILVSLFWQKMTRNGAICGMLSGACVVLIWSYFASYHIIFELEPIVPGFIICLVCIYYVSIFSKSLISDQTSYNFKKMQEQLLENN